VENRSAIFRNLMQAVRVAGIPGVSRSSTDLPLTATAFQRLLERVKLRLQQGSLLFPQEREQLPRFLETAFRSFGRFFRGQAFVEPGKDHIQKLPVRLGS